MIAQFSITKKKLYFDQDLTKACSNHNYFFVQAFMLLKYGNYLIKVAMRWSIRLYTFSARSSNHFMVLIDLRRYEDVINVAQFSICMPVIVKYACTEQNIVEYPILGYKVSKICKWIAYFWRKKNKVKPE